MSSPLNDLRQHGYRMPIPRSPTIHLPEDPEEDIPAPYAYTEIMTPDIDRDALKAKFMAACNARRFHHIIHADVKIKVPK